MPTLSIGNLSAGGTGKTPLLFFALEWLERHGAEVGVLSRGYGGDEGRMLEERFPKVRLVENPDRREGLACLQASGGAEVLLLDDGFQHLKLARDLDVVILDATRPFGRSLPAGLMREQPRALRRAHAVVLSRTELVEPARVAEIWQTVDAARTGLPALPRYEGGMVGVDFRNLADDRIVPIGAFAGQSAHLACGIGNPQSFAQLVESHGIHVSKLEMRGDHHAWSAADMEPWAGVDRVLVTEKDGVKLRPFATPNLWELRAAWTFHRGGEDFEELLNHFYLPVRAARIEPLWTAQDPDGQGVRQ